MYNKLVSAGVVAMAAALPLVAGAQSFDSFDATLQTISGWINAIIPLLIGVAVLVFLFGVLQYVTAGADEEKRKKGAYLIGYGVVAIFVMVSVWGLVNILINTFNLETDAPDDLPEVPTIPSTG